MTLNDGEGTGVEQLPWPILVAARPVAVVRCTSARAHPEYWQQRLKLCFPGLGEATADRCRATRYFDCELERAVRRRMCRCFQTGTVNTGDFEV
jgi:hypothetical protein